MPRDRDQEMIGLMAVLAEARGDLPAGAARVMEDSVRYGNSGDAIEAQESAGQTAAVASGRLPTRGLTEVATELGITIIGPTCDLFSEVQLPEGWTIRATDHSMWNEVLDDKGEVRATYFYKAAFYDRDAFINLKR